MSMPGAGYWMAVAPFALSAACTGLSIPVAHALGLLDCPGAITSHEGVIPRFGGIGIVAGVLVPAVLRGTTSPFALLGLVVIAAVGALDDRFGLPPGGKLCGQIAAGLCLGAAFVAGPLGLAGVLVAVVLAVALTNAVNLIDGLDGLAAGYTVTAALGLAVVMNASGMGSAFAVSLALAALGFLLWNFPRARTFMGDTGSLAIGYCLAFLLMRISAVSWQGALSALPMVAIPAYDMSLVIIRRRRQRRSLLEGDRNHFYDVLYRRLGSARLTVAVVCAASLALASLGVLTTRLALASTLGLYGAVLLLMAAAAPRLGFLPSRRPALLADALDLPPRARPAPPAPAAAAAGADTAARRDSTY
jgi:UDP-GlcNAc:undecaprenyl-phosphate GlcNAc-1-phosphate transferase